MKKKKMDRIYRIFQDLQDSAVSKDLVNPVVNPVKEALIKYGFVIPAKAGIQNLQNVTGSPLSRGRLNQRFLNPVYWLFGLDLICVHLRLSAAHRS